MVEGRASTSSILIGQSVGGGYTEDRHFQADFDFSNRRFFFRSAHYPPSTYYSVRCSNARLLLLYSPSPPHIMKGVTLDFNGGGSKKPRSGVPVHVVTTANRSKDFSVASRVEEAEPLLKSGTQHLSGRSKTYICCAVVLTMVIVGVVVAAIAISTSNNHDDNSTNDDDDSITTMIATTTVPMAAVPDATEPATKEEQHAEDGGTGQVSLQFLCNHVLEGNQAGNCLAVFSYDNPSGEVVNVERGANNFVEPGPQDIGQTSTFAAGQRFGGASFKWNCETHTQARWTVRSGGGVSVATAPQTHIDCPPLPL